MLTWTTRGATRIVHSFATPTSALRVGDITRLNMFAQEIVQLGSCWQTHVSQAVLKFLSSTGVGKIKKGVIRGEAVGYYYYGSFTHAA